MPERKERKERTRRGKATEKKWSTPDKHGEFELRALSILMVSRCVYALFCYFDEIIKFGVREMFLFLPNDAEFFWNEKILLCSSDYTFDK